MKQLKLDDVDIYGINICDEYIKLPYYKSLLSSDELIKAGRFFTEKLTNDYIVCRGYLRLILSNYLNINPEDLMFKYNNYGKPEIESSKNNNLLRFNVSHSGSYFIIGITYKNSIGIDIEEMKPIDNYKSIANQFFSDKEKEIVNNLDDFYYVWSQKEAVIKASGMGISFGLNHWSTALEADEYTIKIEEDAYKIMNFSIDRGYSSALAIAF